MASTPAKEKRQRAMVDPHFIRRGAYTTPTYRDPARAAWKQYLKDRNASRLLYAVSQEPHQEELLRCFLWTAIGTADQNLIRKLTDKQITLPDESNCSPGYIYQAVEVFADPTHAIEWLLGRWAKINARGPNDWTALHLACNRARYIAVEVLVNKGADVNAVTACDGGWTPLMEACASGHKEIVEFLLAWGQP